MRLTPRRSGLLLAAAATLAGTGWADSLILVGPNVGRVEQNAAETLAADLRERMPDDSVKVAPGGEVARWRDFDQVFVIGTAESQPWFGSRQASRFGITPPDLGPEAFWVHVGPAGNDKDSPQVIAVAGGDVRGVHYGVSHVATKLLDIDPLAFWTGKETSTVTDLELPEYRYQAREPAYKLRGYFDNDNDMLANFSGRKLVVEIELWREMIDSLVRLGYNYIDPHDALGRPEYYLRDYYLEMTDYQTDLELVEQIIDYAHLKGMLVQIPMYLGWEFKHLTFEEVCLSEHHDRWMEIYDYYLNETPLGKGDLFLARPRHPIYDWPYRCPTEEAAGIDPGPLMTRMFNELEERVKQRNPDAVLVCDLWMEGLPMWRTGRFDPGKSVMMMWADHGFADFPEGWPSDFQGHGFGIYLHAGVWKNQVVQDPYPHRIRDALREGARRGMTENLLVNGQNFKGFLLNLEASALAGWDPEGFDPDAFYAEWTERYFGSAAAPLVVKALEALHAAHEDVNGFRDVMKDSRQLLRHANQGRMEHRDLLPHEQSLEHAEQALGWANQAAEHVPASASHTFEDQVRYPIRIFIQNLRLHLALGQLSNTVFEGALSPDQREIMVDVCTERLRRFRETLAAGSGWDKWAGWYAPENFRIHTPPPTFADLEPLLLTTEAAALSP